MTHVEIESGYLVDRRVVLISALAIGLGLAGGLIAQALVSLIGFVTNVSFYGRASASFVSPAENHLGLWVIGVPVVGGIIVGFMARYGSKAIRGHGIPEAMEQILLNESKIPARITVLKPLSAAIAIGTGGPFGAEGPIIATGGALGSLVGQLLPTTAAERKTLLASGAAAGMTATFGSPVSAVLLAVELLLFEFRPRSLIPVALASSAAAAVRLTLMGARPIFDMPDIAFLPGSTIAWYILIGAIVGVAAVWVTKLVYYIEDLFEELPIHWATWPALGAVVVGVVGYFYPRTLGVGYVNIEDIISGRLIGTTMIIFCVMKLVSWSIALGSGTSGGTLAPLFTIGGGLGSALGALFHVDPRVGGLVGMAAIFAGASRALLASVVFAFETTHQYFGLLPLLGGCASAYFISCLLMRTTIMTEKIERRGTRVPAEYLADYLAQVLVRDYCTREVVTLPASATVAEAQKLLATDPSRFSHQGFPIVISDGNVIGVLTRRDLLEAGASGEARLQTLVKREPLVVYEMDTLRDAADIMTQEAVGRLIVVGAGAPRKPIGILTRSDLLEAHQKRLKEGSHRERARKFAVRTRPART